MASAPLAPRSVPVTGKLRSPRGLWVLPAVLAVAGVLSLGATRSPIRAALLGSAPFGGSRVEGEAFPKRLVDPTGEVQILAHPPRRIVSGVLASDEILTQLVAPERLLAVSKFALDPGISNCAALVPPQALRLDFGQAESILRLEPELVVLDAYNREEFVRLLAAAGAPVLRLSGYGSFAAIERNLLVLGAAVGEEARAGELAGALRARLAEVERRVRGRPRPRVLYFVPGGYSAGTGALADEIIERAGGYNLGRELRLKGTAKISLEAALLLEPEVIFLPDWGIQESAEMLEQFAQGAVWEEVPARKNGRIHAVRAAWIDSVTHYAAKGLEEVARILHPEAWPETWPEAGTK